MGIELDKALYHNVEHPNVRATDTGVALYGRLDGELLEYVAMQGALRGIADDFTNAKGRRGHFRQSGGVHKTMSGVAYLLPTKTIFRVPPAVVPSLEKVFSIALLTFFSQDDGRLRRLPSCRYDSKWRYHVHVQVVGNLFR